jgi:hypothetical protein
MTVEEYLGRRSSSAHPFGFLSIEQYEAAVAAGELTVAYAKDQDLNVGKKAKPKSKSKKAAAIKSSAKTKVGKLLRRANRWGRAQKDPGEGRKGAR